jgi:hypothetical protein
VSVDRSALGRLGALSLHAQYDSRSLTENARKAAACRFERQVLEAAAAKGEVLTQAEIQRRAQYLARAHMVRMALASAKARAARRGTS